jgi:hypothetical protein
MICMTRQLTRRERLLRERRRLLLKIAQFFVDFEDKKIKIKVPYGNYKRA